ncbi:MAG: ATP-binding protein [Actinobacteria bacterium]|nr:ATP-binding protein [Actinomycetota bacterium]
MTEYLDREISPALEHALENMPVVVLTGMRQSGKSTLLTNQSSLKNRMYISFDDYSQLEFARKNPEELLSSSELITIDEVQKYPDILTTIKQIVDKKRTPGKFLLSGSANLLLLNKISESLAGRAIYLTLYPFNKREITNSTFKTPFLLKLIESPDEIDIKTQYPIIKLSEVLTGGMPVVCLKKVEDPEIWYRGYEQTYLERDIRDLSKISDLIPFRNLLRLTAFRTAQILKISELSRDAKLNSVRTSSYLSLMQASFIINLIEPFLSSRAARLIKSPKLYFSDSGIAGYLMGVDHSEEESEEPIRGALYETYVAQNILSILVSKIPRSRLMFWNIQGRHEVDFIIESGQSVIAIEVKSNTRWTESGLSGLGAFISNTPSCKAAILAYNGERIVKLGANMWAIPLSALLS